MMPAMFSKAKRSPSKLSSLTASPSTTTEGSVTLQALSLPPTTPRAGDEDVLNPTGSPQEPSAFPDVVDDTDDDACVASVQADLSAMHLNARVEVPSALNTIVEESESHGSSPAVSLTAEEAVLLLTTIDGVVQSSIEALEAVAKAEQCLRELEESQDIDESNPKPTSFDRSDVTHVSDATSAPECATNAEEDIDDAADEGDAIFHDAQDGTNAETPTTEAGVLEVAHTTAFGQYGSDDDEGSSVYSFATTAPSFAGDENAAPSIVSSPFWEERTSRPPGVASPHRPAWNPDWMEHQSRSRTSEKTDAQGLNDAHDGGADQVDAATATPLLLQDETPPQQDTGNDVDRIESHLSFKQEEEPGQLVGEEEVRTADVVPADLIDVLEVEAADHVVVVDETPVEEAESVPNPVELPLASSHFTCLGGKVSTDEVDVSSVNDELTPKAVAPLPTTPRSYVPSFTGIPPAVTTGVSYRQLSVELNTETDGESNFYRVALQKLKQERQLRRLNPTVLEPIVSAPSSNKSAYDDEDEEERRARLNKIDELRKRTSAFEVKIGKPCSVGRVPYVKS